MLVFIKSLFSHLLGLFDAIKMGRSVMIDSWALLKLQRWMYGLELDATALLVPDSRAYTSGIVWL